MHHWLLAASTLLAAIAGASGMWSLHKGHRSRRTSALMLAVLLLQFAFLSRRGQLHQACPLTDKGEILAFVSWSLTLFYFLVGRGYRISLIGIFTAPLVVIFQSIALLPGSLGDTPLPDPAANPLHEIHSATSAMAYGAFALAAVAGTMFLTLDYQLKEQHLQSYLFRNLPPVRTIITSLQRLLIIGFVLLTIGITAGFLMPHDMNATAHLITALIVWAGYLTLLVIKFTRGLAGRHFALAALAWFVLSLGVFAFV